MAFEKIERRTKSTIFRNPQHPATVIKLEDAVFCRFVDRTNSGKGDQLTFDIGINIMTKLGLKPEERVAFLIDRQAGMVKILKDDQGFKLSRAGKKTLKYCVVSISRPDGVKPTFGSKKVLCRHEIVGADNSLLITLPEIEATAVNLPTVASVEPIKVKLNKEVTAKICKNSASKATFSTSTSNHTPCFAIRIGIDLIEEARMRVGDTVDIDFDRLSNKLTIIRSANSGIVLKRVPESRYSLMLIMNLSQHNVDYSGKFTKAAYFETAGVRADGAIILGLPTVTQIDSNKNVA